MAKIFFRGHYKELKCPLGYCDACGTMYAVAKTMDEDISDMEDTFHTKLSEKQLRFAVYLVHNDQKKLVDIISTWRNNYNNNMTTINAKKDETTGVVSSTSIVDEKKENVNSIDHYLAMRSEFIEKVNAICVEGQDYHVIQGKKSLGKGGAEKIASIFKWTAQFEKDTDTLSMLGNTAGLVVLKCTLMNGQFVGEGRGASTLAKNSGDPNKTIKMAQKSAFIDAVLRASGLSDFFTQDLEDMPQEEIKPIQQAKTVFSSGRKEPTEKQKYFIDKLCREKGVNNLEELKEQYPNPSKLIDYLLSLPADEAYQIGDSVPF